MRKFEVVLGFEDAEINLPKRQTKNAAGYDFEAAADVMIPPIWRTIRFGMNIKPIGVPTGIKAVMGKDEVLMIHNRSGNPIKNFLLLDNGVGVVDSDYYNNDKNDGHIMFHFWNFGITEKHIKKGDRIGQGVFQKFLLVDNDTEPKNIRTGGHGSTDDKLNKK